MIEVNGDYKRGREGNLAEKCAWNVQSFLPRKTNRQPSGRTSTTDDIDR